MAGTTYRILMRTPLGDRAGTLEVQIEKESIRGFLNILKHSEPFEGRIDRNGCCSIRGNLITLKNIIPYTATGRIAAESLHLFLRSGRNLFPVTGTAFQGDPHREPSHSQSKGDAERL